ncbi:LysR family transcriptional regulator [Novosphingobium subterraneum]|uniref:LysR family transcriptional regulator n=2 Tax=Novosphingobium subterraneum TaxID=48936 RepID=A0A0B9A0T2_9SPHN|nr:LysR family transcriptional regulator [Novosphingobium subterraneum]
MTARAHRLHAPMIVYFDAIRRAGSVREAARRLNVASSAVNRQLLKLEAELGTPLFERLPAGLKLTHAGAAFARHALEVLQDAERVRSELEALQGLRTGHIEIGAVEALVSELLPDLLAEFRLHYPRITVGVNVMGSSAIPGALTGGEVDLGIAFGLDRSTELQQLGVATFALGVVMRPDHPLAQQAELSLSACLAFPLILPKSDLSIFRILNGLVGNMPQGIVQTNSVELAKQLTLRGFGLSFQTRVGIEREIIAGDLIHIPIRRPKPITTDLGFYVRTAKSAPVGVHALVDLFAVQRNGTTEPLLSSHTT